MTDTSSPHYPIFRSRGMRRNLSVALFVGLLLLTLMSALFASLVMKMLVNELGTYAQLNKRGERVEATVSARRAGEDASGATYFLTYRFEAGNQTFEQEVKVYEHEYTLSQQGMPLSVLYLPDDPNTAMPAMVIIRETRVAQATIVIIPLGFLGVPALLFVVWWWIFRRPIAKLRKHGVITEAAITNVRREHRYAPQIFTFTFDVRGSDGTARSIIGQEQLAVNSVSFKTGDTIRVRYLTRKPEVFMIEAESLLNASIE